MDLLVNDLTVVLFWLSGCFIGLADRDCYTIVQWAEDGHVHLRGANHSAYLVFLFINNAPRS